MMDQYDIKSDTLQLNLLCDDRLEWYTQSLTILKIGYYMTTGQDGTLRVQILFSWTYYMSVLPHRHSTRLATLQVISSRIRLSTLQITPSMRMDEEE
jgi:hypothetical protein